MKRFAIAGFCAVLLTIGFSAAACTGVTVRATNGDVVFCRTMEFAFGFVDSEILISPRNRSYKAQLPESMPGGMSWQGKYGVAGIAATRFGAYIDGMNEKGLAAGVFYHDGFAQYAKYSPERAANAISSLDALALILSTCANIDEVRQALAKVEVVDIGLLSIGIPASLHYMVTEPGGKQVVIEYVDGKPKFFESKVGVIANSPNYDWHLLNLGNYIGLPKPETQTWQLGEYTVKALDAGTDLIGLPGDFTSPSRFVRAAILTHYARKTPNAKEAVYQAFQIMDSFNIPVYCKDPLVKGNMEKARSETSWTVANDLTNRTLYFHTSNDRMVQKIDVSRIDFGKLTKLVKRKIDNGEMTVLDRTAEITVE